MSGIKDLVESYYNDVYIEEEVLDEQGRRTGSNPNVYTPAVSQGARRGAAPVPGSTKPQIGSLPPNARQVTQYPQGVSTGVGGGNAGASTVVSRPAAAPVARPLPAGAPKLGLTVTSPGAAKVAPTAATTAKPATTTPTARPSLKSDIEDLRKMRTASQMRQQGKNLPSGKVPTGSDL